MIMQRTGMGWLRAALAVSLMGLFAASCAEEVGDIDRTSPNKIKKTQFSGLWYYLQTMVDVPQQSAQGFIGNTNFGNAAKVVFDLTESYLYVLPVTETVQFSEKPYQLKKLRNFWDAGKSNEFVEIYVGQPLAAFPVTHFDVIRDYNTSTGKQGNTLSENTTDRVWHERDYVRVNWGGNSILDWAFPAGSSQFSAVDHYVQEVEDPFLRPAGAGENPDLPEFEDGYISFVTKAFAPPSSANWQGYICDPYGMSNTDCAGSVLKLRHSLKRAPATPDVETFVYKNSEHMDKFGFFLAERHAYDELWDMTESARDYKGQRWNLWQKTWEYTDMTNASGKAIACQDNADCGSDDKVLDYQALRCVKDSVYKPGTCKKGELLPLAERGLNPIIYHLSASLPPEGNRNSMLRQFYKSADEWSRAFKDALAWGLLLEEKGQYWTQACETNTDCTKGREDVLVDTTVAMPRTVVGSKTWITCNAATPCDKNQLCKTDSDNVDKCFDAAGELVIDEELVAGTRRAVMVIYQNAGVNVIPVKEDQKLTGTKPSVRFVNASGGSQTLTADGQSVATHETKAGEWVTEVAQLDAKSTVLTVGGASQTVTLANNFDYLVVFTGDSLIVSGTARAAAEGVRFLHAVQNKPVDVGVNAIRAAEGLRYEGVTTYAPQDFDEARITVTEAGAQGDLTCYFTGHEGRCTGWSAGWTEADDDRLATLKATVPDMFILCENQYDDVNEAADMKDAADAGDTFATRGADWKLMSKAIHDGRYSVKGKNLYNWGGKQNLDNANAIFNPCKDMVPNPTQMKKIGDMRYNYIYWVGENQAASPLGYGPSAGDPETGQLIWGTAYIYGAPTLTYGQASMDLVDLVNGNIDPKDVVSGDYIRKWILEKGDVLPSDNSATLFEGGLRTEEGTLAHFTHPQFDGDGIVQPATDPFSNPDIMKFLNDKQMQRELFSTLPTVQNGHTQNRADAIRGTTLEDMMITEEVRMGLTGQMDVGNESADLHAKLSPASWATGGHAHDVINEGRNKALAQVPCSFERSFMDDSIYGISKEFFCSDAEKATYASLSDAEKESAAKKCLTGDDLRWEITTRIVSGLTEHEVGHTVGLRHNFAGSVDLFNFHDEYFNIKKPEQVYCKTDGFCDDDMGEACAFTQCNASTSCPAGLSCNAGKCIDASDAETGLCAVGGTPVERLAPRPKWNEEEKLNKIYEYQYSTVMDYGGIFNSDAHGLGKYDYAAMKFGYFKMVDTYADVSKIRNRIDKMADRFGDPSQFSYYLDTSGWRFAGVLFSPFYYLEAYIGVEENKKRRAVSYEQVKLEHAMQSNYDYGELYWTHIEVPYRFCSDEFNGNLGCYVYDMGVDVGETVNNAIAKLDEHYIIDAFKRDSLFKGNFINTYYNRILSRYMNILGDTGRYLAIYDNIFRRYSWYQDFSQNIYSLGTLAKATRASFNHLAQLVAAPAPGSFMQGADGIYRNVSYDEVAGAELVVPLGTGKYPYSQFMAGDNYGFENHVVWVGSFWTKLAALVTLTDSTFYSSSDWVGEQLPVGRSTSVGFNTLYTRELTNLIGGIISESLDAYSGVVEKDPAGKPLVRPRDLFNPEANVGTAIIEPGLNNLTMKLYAAFNGLVNLGAGFDPSFGDSMAVFIEGNGAQFDLNAGGNGVEVARFDDPFGSKTYVAYTPNYDAGRIAPAYAIVKRAQDNREAWNNAAGNVKMELERQLRKDIETLDVLRSFHDIYGSLTY